MDHFKSELVHVEGFERTEERHSVYSAAQTNYVTYVPKENIMSRTAQTSAQSHKFRSPHSSNKLCHVHPNVGGRKENITVNGMKLKEIYNQSKSCSATHATRRYSLTAQSMHRRLVYHRYLFFDDVMSDKFRLDNWTT